jgi:solute carrier family 25 carnitine/acylcarnitine transporter 20/29
MDKHFLAGLISGTSQVIAGHPFDTLKVNIQNNNLKLFTLNFKNLYQGISYPLVTNSITVSIQFGVYSKLKNNNFNEIISSAGAGFVTGFMSSPIDRFKIKKQILAKDIYAKPFKGMSLTLLREVPANIIYFGTYNYLRNNKFNILLSGGIAGFLSWLITYPIDVIKTRIQSDKYINIKSAIMKKNFYKGLTPCLLRAIFVNSIGFYVYETTMKII